MEGWCYRAVVASPWVYTVVLHRLNPATLDMPVFIGLLTPHRGMAEREGFESSLTRSSLPGGDA
jgi:hypothetical protein